MGVILFLACITGACGGTRSTCDVARDRLNECNAQLQHEAMLEYVRLPLDLSTCGDAVSTCVAECVVASNCPAIEFTELVGSQTDPNGSPPPPGAGEFEVCVDKCIELSQSSAGAPND